MKNKKDQKTVNAPKVQLTAKLKMSYTDMIRVYGAEKAAQILNNF